MPKLVIRNGRVIDPASNLDAVCDVFCVNGYIASIGEKLYATGAEEFDATGLIVAPGFIDMHVHLREPGFEHAETIETGSRAAAGGATASSLRMRTRWFSRVTSRRFGLTSITQSTFAFHYARTFR